MTKIIDGKRYNTETATEVAEYSNGLGTSDFRYVNETLYRTPNGRWFILYDGGAMSSHARSCGNNSWCGGHGLQAFTDDQAFEWLQEHNEAEALEEHFAHRLSDA